MSDCAAQGVPVTRQQPTKRPTTACQFETPFGVWGIDECRLPHPLAFLLAARREPRGVPFYGLSMAVGHRRVTTTTTTTTSKWWPSQGETSQRTRDTVNYSQGRKSVNSLLTVQHCCRVSSLCLMMLPSPNSSPNHDDACLRSLLPVVQSVVRLVVNYPVCLRQRIVNVAALKS